MLWQRVVANRLAETDKHVCFLRGYTKGVYTLMPEALLVCTRKNCIGSVRELLRIVIILTCSGNVTVMTQLEPELNCIIFKGKLVSLFN